MRLYDPDLGMPPRDPDFDVGNMGYDLTDVDRWVEKARQQIHTLELAAAALAKVVRSEYGEDPLAYFAEVLAHASPAEIAALAAWEEAR
jgi:hypothetical protein